MRPILLVLACAAILACGSDGGELSVDEYRDEANELCAEATDQAKKFDLPRSVDGMADYLERLLEFSRPYDRRFRELDPPDELARTHERGVEASETLDREFERIIDRLRAAEDPAVTLRREVERLLPEISQADEIYRRLGLDECLVGPQLGDPGGPS